jgi:hypothetical protein
MPPLAQFGTVATSGSGFGADVVSDNSGGPAPPFAALELRNNLEQLLRQSYGLSSLSQEALESN